MIEENISNIEKYLRTSLRPVKPSLDYIGRLQKQLRNAKSVILENQTQTLILGVVLSGIIVGSLLLFLLKPSRKCKAK